VSYSDVIPSTFNIQRKQEFAALINMAPVTVFAKVITHCITEGNKQGWCFFLYLAGPGFDYGTKINYPNSEFP
jgi:hypothetical protein